VITNIEQDDVVVDPTNQMFTELAWLSSNYEQDPDTDTQGYLKGKQWQPRQIAEFGTAAGFDSAENLFMVIAVCLAESQGYDHAYNDNLDPVTHQVKSRDCGMMQVNIPASAIGTNVENDLYDPTANFVRAYAIYKEGGWGRWASVTSEVYLRPYYSGRACLGAMNWGAESFNELGATLPVPIFTLAQLRARLKW
jgi:hypothetical protein